MVNLGGATISPGHGIAIASLLTKFIGARAAPKECHAASRVPCIRKCCRQFRRGTVTVVAGQGAGAAGNPARGGREHAEHDGYPWCRRQSTGLRSVLEHARPADE